MGGTARQFNKMYVDYKKRFKKPIQNIARLMPQEFSDSYFVETFKKLYPDLWEDLNKQYKYWHDKNDVLIKYGKKSRYNFRKPYNFILDCSYYCRIGLRKNMERDILSKDEVAELEAEILQQSKKKIEKCRQKEERALYHVQEVEPMYAKAFIDAYFKTHDLHRRLEIMREMSKYKSDNIISFFYKVNASTRNFSLKEEAMKYIQGMGLPFVLRRKKKGKKTYIDNEKVKNNSSPEILMQRLYVDELEKLKEYDLFLSHNSQDEGRIVEIYKALNAIGLVAYIDWVNDKYDLKRQWCNASTAQVIKERIRQSKVFVIYLSEKTLSSQWCPWELGYADALGKNICVYEDKDISKPIPQFYSVYPRLCMDTDCWIIDGERKVMFENWIKEKG